MGRAANGQFTSEVHQLARDAEAKGRQQLAAVSSELVSPTALGQPEAAATNLVSLNAMLKAKGACPLDKVDFQAYQCWITFAPLSFNPESVADWENSADGQQWAAECIADNCQCQRRCVCMWRGMRPAPMISGITCDDYQGLDDLGELINYGWRSHPEHWQPSGGDENLPDDEDAALSDDDTDYLSVPELTSFCTSCRRIRDGERGLSHVETQTNGRVMCVHDGWCLSCREVVRMM